MAERTITINYEVSSSPDEVSQDILRTLETIIPYMVDNVIIRSSKGVTRNQMWQLELEDESVCTVEVESFGDLPVRVNGQNVKYRHKVSRKE